MKRVFTLVLVGVAAGLALAGRGAGAAGRLDDATIFAIYDQANTADILTGRLAAKYGASEEVRALGRMVATDHVAVQQMGRDLAKKLGVMPTPPEGDTSIAEYAKAVALLQSKRGEEFDREYLRYEVAFHQGVIDAVKETLLPAVSHPELRSLIATVLPGFEHHLAATKAAAAKMGVK